jgi:DNA adenine methylase
MVETALRPVPSARAVAPYVGGKKQLAKLLAERIESTPHSLYGEVFAGMAGVFFKRRLAPKVEVLNDLNGDVANLFRILQRHYQAFMDMLKWQLTKFDRLNGQDPERLTDLERAARFLYVQRVAFGGKVVGRSFGLATTTPARFDVTKLEAVLADAHERLAGVWIERLSWETFLDRWDRPGALFFLDPPYYGTEHYYGRGVFARADFERMAERLSRLQGRFIMTVSDVPELRDTFGRFHLDTADVTYTAGGADNVRRLGELIITG